MTYHTHMDSPIGKLLLVADDKALLSIAFAGHAPKADSQDRPSHPILQSARRQLDEYFAGRRTRFELPLAPAGTPFQKSVWKALRGIPYGKTCSYGDIARKIGNPKAVRAVGLANGANPIPLVIPCHRVIGSNGTLTGYGGGLDRKRKLLALEGRTRGQSLTHR